MDNLVNDLVDFLMSHDEVAVTDYGVSSYAVSNYISGKVGEITLQTRDGIELYIEIGEMD